MLTRVKRFIRSRLSVAVRATPKGKSGARLRISPEVEACHNEDGLVLLHTGKGIVFKANAIGARIWERVVLEYDTDACATELTRKYGVSHERVEKDIAGFIRDLRHHDLILDGGLQ
jgi:hypothetical protein